MKRKFKVNNKVVDAETIVEAVKNYNSVEDERLSPMTYKKLREMGYNEDRWKGMSQEEANRVVASGKKEEARPSNKREEKTEEVKTSKESKNTNYLPKEKRYGSNPELDEWVDSRYAGVRMDAARQGYGLNKLIDDRDDYVRLTVAEQGYGLDKLVDDESEVVRHEVARQGYGLDKLVNDKNNYVREAVAEQGYGLDKLIYDENIYVRRAAAEKIGELIREGKASINIKEDK